MSDGGERVEAPVEAPASINAEAAATPPGRRMTMAEVREMGAGVRPGVRHIPLCATAGWIRDYVGMEPSHLYYLRKHGKVAWAKIGKKLTLYRVPDVLAVLRAERAWRHATGIDEDLEWIEAQQRREEESPWDGSDSVE